MELTEESLKKCYKFEHPIFDNLNITYNTSNSLIVLWNRYQIFVYEDMNFERIWKVFVPEFQVQQLIISSNYLVCLDNSGRIYTSSLKFKNPAQKRFKSTFQLRDENLMVCTQNQDNILSLKYESMKYFLCDNKVNADFMTENKIELTYKGSLPLPEPTLYTCMLISHKLIDEDKDCISNIFQIEQSVNLNDSYLVLMSFDNLSVHTCLYHSKGANADVVLAKLYTCPTEICNIEVIKKGQLSILIGLKIGTVIRCFLKDITKAPDIIHLNTALYKCVTIQDTLIYTDGKSMWKCEDTFTNNIIFKKFFVRHVKDLIRIGDKILCTSFTNMLYMFQMDDDSVNIKSITTEKYCSAELLLNNSEYLYKIIEEVNKNNQITKRLHEEGSYITAFSLSKRQDVMENLLHYNVTVYEKYEDAIKENSDVTLTENRCEYFKPRMFYILLNLTTTSLHHIFDNMLSNMYDDIKVHITFASDNRLLKTTSVKIIKDFKKLNILLPCDIMDDNISVIKVNIKLVSSIPGAFDEKQRLWLTLYRKNIVLKSEHILRPSMTCYDYISLKDPIEPIGDIIFKTAMLQYGNLVSVTDTTKYHVNAMDFSLYAKLPNDYFHQFKDQSKIECLSHLSNRNAIFLLDHFKVDEFLKTESYLYFDVANTYVKIDILNDDFANPMLKVSSRNMVVAFHIRNFISDFINNNFSDHGPKKEYVKHTLYNVLENLQKEIRECLLSHQNYEEFQAFAEQFEKNVIGTLPL